MKTRSQNSSKELNASLSKIVKSSQREKTKLIKISKLLKNGANINYQDENGNTLLHLASNPGEVNLLLKLDADVNITNFFGETALLYILKKPRNVSVSARIKLFKKTKAMVKEFIRYYYYRQDNILNVNLKDIEGNTPLFEYISRNECDINIVKLLVNHRAIIDIQSTSQNTLLHVAVSNSFCKIGLVKYLIELGLKPTAVNSHGQTPLHLAVRIKSCKSNIVEELIRHGASILSQDYNLYTPLLSAVLNAHCNKKLLNVLLNGLELSLINEKVLCCGGTYLHAAMKHRNIDVIKTLITSGAEVNATNKSGYTPLHMAVTEPNCDEEVINVLVKYGADVNIKDKRNTTPLHVAFEKTANMNVIKTLLLSKARMCVVDFRGYTPFHYIESNRNINKQFLIELLSSEDCIITSLKLTAYHKNLLIMLSHTSRKISFCKTVLKYLFLKYSNYIYAGKLPLVVKVFFSKLDGNSWNFYNEFYQDCICEISLMRSDKIWNHISFYDIMINEFSVLTLNLDNEVKKQIIDAVLVRMTNDQYPIYKDMVMYVRKKDFLKNLDAVRINAIVCKDGIVRKITLDQFPVRHIAKYLSKQDVINLILVYSQNADSFEAEDSNMDERSVEISQDASIDLTREVRVNIVRLSQKELKKLCKPCTVNIKNSIETRKLIESKKKALYGQVSPNGSKDKVNDDSVLPMDE